jgi:hypothetical protein
MSCICLWPVAQAVPNRWPVIPGLRPELPHEESRCVRQIWHTPRYWVAMGFRPESGDIRPFYALYRHLELWAGACAPDGMAMQHDASPPSPRLEGRISATYAPRWVGG